MNVMQILMRGMRDGHMYMLVLRGVHLAVLQDDQVVVEKYLSHEIESLALAINAAKAVFSALVPGAEDLE